MLTLLAAAAASLQPAPEVGYTELMRGEDSAAIVVIGADAHRYDPAKFINLAIAHARRGETDLARQHFQAVIDRREITELETATGEWFYARAIARRGLAMLDQGVFTAGNRLAIR
jgi:hypothetical protein